MKRLRLILAVFLPLLFLAPVGTITAQHQTAQQVQDPKTTTVYITRTGKRYHRAGCRYLSQSHIKTTLAEAKANGYTPCRVCNPPQ